MCPSVLPLALAALLAAPLAGATPEPAPLEPAPLEAARLEAATPGDLLAALQQAAREGDAEAFASHFELFPEEREAAEEYAVPGLMPGGDWHEAFLALTAADLDPNGGGVYTLSLHMEWEVEGEEDTFESSILMTFAAFGEGPSGEDYRVVSVLMAG